MRIGYIECFAGISGDMMLGALVDAGVPLSVLEDAARSLNVGAHLHAKKVMRAGLGGTKVDVHAHEDGHVAHTHQHDHAHHHADHVHAPKHSHDHAHDHSHSHENENVPAHTHDHDHAHSHDHAHRSLSAILDIIDASGLSSAVRQRARRAFQLLGEAEAKMHNVPIESVHFHEVGAVDTIIDIVCTAAAVEHLGVDRWIASALNVGSGTVQCAHGTLPVPAPATLELLGSAPVYAAGPPMERVTPTGAAILRMLDAEYVQLPPVRVVATGYGAGGKDTPSQPNLVRVQIAEAADQAATDKIAILACVIDDATPQLLAYVSELLLAAGAWDVYRSTVQMKKGRSGVELTVLSSPDKLEALRALVFRETTTIGVHWRIEDKMALSRSFAEVATPWGPVRIKIAALPCGEVTSATPEYEDCRSLAVASGVPLKLVQAAAMRAYAQSREV